MKSYEHYSSAYTRALRLAKLAAIRKELSARKVVFDTIVVCGRSGLLMGLPLSHAMRKRLLIVSKAIEMEKSHSGAPLIGEGGKRLLFLDDMIGTGRTRNWVEHQVEENHDVKIGWGWVGTLVYNDINYERRPRFVKDNMFPKVEESSAKS